MIIKPFLTSIGILALGSVVWAGNAGPFVETKGVREFTGTMLVRPIQPDVLLRQGALPSTAAAIHARAYARVQNGTVRVDKDIDYAVVRVPKGTNETSYANSLMATGDYEYVVPNWRVFVQGKVTPNDPRFSSQWQHKVMQSTDAWGVWKGTNNVTVAIVDTGVMITHEDLKAGMVNGYNAVDKKAQVDGGDVVDTHGHGTHCAGDAAAQGNNGIGLVGEGWGYKIMPVRASISGSASFDDLVDGAKWAVNHGAKSISVSFSGVDTPLVGSAGTYIKQHGGLLLWAAGNDGRNLSGFSYPDVIVVGASTPSDGQAGFSAYGRGVGVFAPGTGIWSTALGGGYVAEDGTSMATPIANGVCAMVWSINPSLSPAKVQSIVYSTCDQIGSPSIFGHGRVNLYRAALAAKATLNTKIDFAPNAVSVLQGTYLSGNLTNIINNSGTGYQTNSITLSQVGQSMVDEVGFKINFPVGSLKVLGATVNMSASAGSSSTAMLYLYNNTTKAYTQIKSAGLPNDGSVGTVTFTMLSDYAKYVAADGTIKLGVRVLSPLGRRGETGTKFTAVVKYARLKTEAQL